VNTKRSLKILLLTLEPGLQGPLPKLYPSFIAALENEGCRVFRSSWGRHQESETLFQKLSGRFIDLFKALAMLARERPDVMYVATSLNARALTRDVPLLLAAAWSPAKKVVKMHGSTTEPLAGPGHSLYKLVTRLLVRLSDAVLLLSCQEEKEGQAFCPSRKYHVVTEEFVPIQPVPSDTPAAPWHMDQSSVVILFVGRLIAAKGIYDLLDAMPVVLRRASVQLLVVGDGPERAALEGRARSLGIDSQVVFTGYLQGAELALAYQRADIFALPSFFAEGFPSSILEAMSAGLPVITTQIRGMADHLVEGVNALFVPVRNPAAVARAILELGADPGLRARMGAANREKVKEFAPDVIGKADYRLLTEVVGS
jgi:glycosyltransferase involved in cell wall biosynthesis